MRSMPSLSPVPDHRPLPRSSPSVGPGETPSQRAEHGPRALLSVPVKWGSNSADAMRRPHHEDQTSWCLQSAEGGARAGAALSKVTKGIKSLNIDVHMGTSSLPQPPVLTHLWMREWMSPGSPCCLSCL